MKFSIVTAGLLILGMSLVFSAAKAEDTVTANLVIKSVHPDGTIVENKMSIASPIPEEVTAIVNHFASQVNVPPSDPDDDMIISVQVVTE